MSDDTAQPTPVPATPASPKPGYKTTEFWLTKAAMVVGALLASGLITSVEWLRALGIAAVVLTSLGYTVARTMIKNATMIFILLIGVGMVTQTACHGTTPQILHIVEDCITKERPAITDLVKKWTDTKPTWAAAESEAISKGLHVGGCALHEFVNTYLTPAPGNHAPDPDSAWAANAAVLSFRAKMKVNDTVTFKTPQGNL